MQGGFGPEDNSYSNILQRSLIEFIGDCTDYVARLSMFDKYIIWRYTIGSSSINSALIFGKLSDNSMYWCYLFFLYFNNTFSSSSNKYLSVPKSFQKYRKYFEKPNKFKKGPISENEIADIISLYTSRLQKIILESPTPSEDISVFKVSSKYPGLPDEVIDSTVYPVLQIPFNSTTIDPHFNFAPFVSPDADCCFFEIHIPKGQHCLFVPPYLHAYPFEKEVLLPHSCIFNIFDKYEENMNYIDTSDVNIISLQDKKNIIMGPVYEIDEFRPCKGTENQCHIKKKQFIKYEAILKS